VIRSWALRLLVCAASAAVGSGIVLGGCASSSAIRFTGTEHPEVPVEDVEIMGDEAPAGFAITGVVTASCETLNGATGVLEAACTRDELLGLSRKRAAAAGGHGLVDVRCNNELLERRHESLDGGGVKTTTRTRLTCRASVVRWTKGRRVPRPRSSAVASASRGGDGRSVLIDDVPVDLSFTPAPGFTEGTSRDASAVGELDAEPAGYAKLGVLAATCAATCAPRHGRAALRKEAARLGATAIAAVHCEVAGADRWQCVAALIGDAVAAPPASVPVASSSVALPPVDPSAGDAAVADAAVSDAAVSDAAVSDAQ
jgi:hypothetical protein